MSLSNSLMHSKDTTRSAADTIDDVTSVNLRYSVAVRVAAAQKP